MPKKKPLSFIPTTVSFSELQRNTEEGNIEEVIGGKEDDLSGLWLEKLILSMLSTLKNDQERVILLVQILRAYGFEFKHPAVAEHLGLNLRWYYRVLRRVREKLAPFRLERGQWQSQEG